MSFAEVILRVGCALVGWLLLFSHALTVAVVSRADCSPALWTTTLLLAIFALVGAGLLPVGLAWRGSLRWLSLPLVLLWALDLQVAIGLLGPASFGSTALCEALVGLEAPGTAPAWQRAWAPAQLVTLLVAAVSVASYWRRSGSR